MGKIKYHSLADPRQVPDITSSQKPSLFATCPGMALNLSQLPELEGKEVGDEIELTIRAQITGIRKPDYWEKGDDDDRRIDIKLLEAALVKK